MILGIKAPTRSRFRREVEGKYTYSIFLFLINDINMENTRNILMITFANLTFYRNIDDGSGAKIPIKPHHR